MTGAVGQRRVPTAYLSGHAIPVPPSGEQRRIVAKIEELFSEIEEGERCLSAVSPIADRTLGLAGKLRHAILKRAFLGRLSAQHDDDESASALLKRIEEERRNRAKDSNSKKRNKAA